LLSEFFRLTLLSARDELPFSCNRYWSFVRLEWPFSFFRGLLRTWGLLNPKPLFFAYLANFFFSFRRLERLGDSKFWIGSLRVIFRIRYFFTRYRSFLFSPRTIYVERVYSRVGGELSAFFWEIPGLFFLVILIYCIKNPRRVGSSHGPLLSWFLSPLPCRRRTSPRIFFFFVSGFYATSLTLRAARELLWLFRLAYLFPGKLGPFGRQGICSSLPRSSGRAASVFWGPVFLVSSFGRLGFCK